MVVVLIRSEYLSAQIFFIWPNIIFQEDFSLLKLIIFSSVYLNYITTWNNMTKEKWVCLAERNVKNVNMIKRFLDWYPKKMGKN